jgi:hypothetical protein
VEHHPLHRHAGLELLQQVPGDGLALAILIRREVELVDVRSRMWPTDDSTTKSSPRIPSMVRALAGDSTITSDLAIRR